MNSVNWTNIGYILRNKIFQQTNLVGKQRPVALWLNTDFSCISCTSEKSVSFYQTTRRNFPEDSHIYARHRENKKSYLRKKLSWVSHVSTVPWKGSGAKTIRPLHVHTTKSGVNSLVLWQHLSRGRIPCRQKTGYDPQPVWTWWRCEKCRGRSWSFGLWHRVVTTPQKHNFKNSAAEVILDYFKTSATLAH